MSQSLPLRDTRMEYEKEKMRECGLLTLFSMLVVIEGIARFIASDSTDATNVRSYLDLDNDLLTPVLSVASACQVFLGFSGLFVGFYGLALDSHNVTITTLALKTKIVLGAFVFLVFTILQPALNASNSLSTPFYFAGYFASTDTDLNSAEMALFGHILPSIAMSGSLQAFQVSSCMRLRHVQQGALVSLSSGPKVALAMLHSGLAVVGGIGTLTLGALILNEDINSNHSDSFRYAPEVQRFNILTVISGALLLGYGLLGFASCFRDHSAQKLMQICAPLLWLWLCVGHVMAQSGVAGPLYALDGPITVVTFTSLVFTPLYCTHEVCRDTPLVLDKLQLV
eukprot:c13236_g1_i1.p1 GENE.c13236_g1_i1~~c13236_g1_i1.p1  ORF type:complete len:340 (+),score=66.15 c13236_g1_i1:152-1171(+)